MLFVISNQLPICEKYPKRASTSFYTDVWILTRRAPVGIPSFFVDEYYLIRLNFAISDCSEQDINMNWLFIYTKGGLDTGIWYSLGYIMPSRSSFIGKHGMSYWNRMSVFLDFMWLHFMAYLFYVNVNINFNHILYIAALLLTKIFPYLQLLWIQTTCSIKYFWYLNFTRMWCHVWVFYNLKYFMCNVWNICSSKLLSLKRATWHQCVFCVFEAPNTFR